MVIKYGGEWLGWFMLSEPIRVSLIHEFEEPLLIQINVWTFNKGKWMERDEFIAPKVVPGISYRYPQMKYKPGVFKMRINAFCKSKQVFSQTISFSYNRTA